MARFDQYSAECLIFTRKAGLFSPVGHDLMLRVGRFDLEVTESRISAKFDPASVAVAHAVRNRLPERGVLSDEDKRKIERILVEEVLETRAYPDIGFESTSVTTLGAGYRIVGELALHGRKRSLTATARQEGGRLVAEIEINQPDFGIKPYSALMGTLRVEPVVMVRMAVPPL